MNFSIDQIASRIYDIAISALAFDPDFDALAEARRINADEGFTIEVSADNQLRGNVTRYEGVRVSDEKLVAAYNLAMHELTNG